jgi:hypothetical protein
MFFDEIITCDRIPVFVNITEPPMFNLTIFNKTISTTLPAAVHLNGIKNVETSGVFTYYTTSRLIVYREIS